MTPVGLWVTVRPIAWQWIKPPEQGEPRRLLVTFIQLRKNDVVIALHWPGAGERTFRLATGHCKTKRCKWELTKAGAQAVRDWLIANDYAPPEILKSALWWAA